MRMSEVQTYIANEVQKEINNQNDRKFLSYSKSLGICLLIYNKYTDNELHLSNLDLDFIHYYELEKQKEKIKYYSVAEGVYGYKYKHGNRKIILAIFAFDVSNNEQIDFYLKKFTGVGGRSLHHQRRIKRFYLCKYLMI